MHRSFPRIVAATACLALLGASLAHAGEVRVNVGGAGNIFSPANINVAPGDHVVWIWLGGMHSVESGNPNSPSNVGDGLFGSTSSPIGQSGAKFSWKVTGSGLKTYYCYPHAPAMAGALNIGAGDPIADFRITEVEFAANGGADRVQISNLGDATGFLGFYRFSSVDGVASTNTTDPVTVTGASSITLHLNASGTNTATDLYFPSHPELGTAGSFALYVPNTTSTGSTSPASLTDPDQMVDYVEWGTAGQAAQPNRSVAVTAGLWPAGDVVETTLTLPNGGVGYSISFCGARTARGASNWQISTPNFGTTPLCTTPTKPATWGRIKSLYR